MVSEEELRRHVDELLEEWDDAGAPQPLHQPSVRQGKKFTGADAARLTSVFGLARHTHETARSIIVLLDARHHSTVATLVRAAYETALTAAWLVQSVGNHGITAFLHEYTRSRTALRNDALKAASAVFRDGAVDVADTDMTPYEGSLDSARQFGQVCEDLAPGGKDAYILYRILSSYSHPTVRTVDLYFGPPQAGTTMPLYRKTPDVPLTREMLLFLTASALVWSARAYSYLTKDQAHRNSLRRRARALNIQDELHLSDTYRQRHARAGKKSSTSE